MTKGDSVGIPLGGKDHIGVVLAVDGEMLLVIGGTSKDRDFPRVTVPHPSGKAAALNLSTTTYFYASGVVRIRADHVRRRPRGRARPDLLLELIEFVKKVSTDAPPPQR